MRASKISILWLCDQPITRGLCHALHHQAPRACRGHGRWAAAPRRPCALEGRTESNGRRALARHAEGARFRNAASTLIVPTLQTNVRPGCSAEASDSLPAICHATDWGNGRVRGRGRSRRHRMPDLREAVRRHPDQASGRLGADVGPGRVGCLPPTAVVAVRTARTGDAVHAARSANVGCSPRRSRSSKDMPGMAGPPSPGFIPQQ